MDIPGGMWASNGEGVSNINKTSRQLD